MSFIPKDLLNYLRSMEKDFGGPLGEIYEKALDKGIPVIPKETACLLKILMLINKPRRVLEIGCAVGFSAGLMAEFSSAEIVTIDRYEEMLQQARGNFHLMGIENRIKLMEGQAGEILPQLAETGERFDFIFMDAAKGQYLDFFPHCLTLLPIGGLLFCDDIFQGGTVAKEKLEIVRRQRTIHKRMNAFIKTACQARGFECALIPIGDGALLGIKTHDEVTFD